MFCIMFPKDKDFVCPKNLKLAKKLDDYKCVLCGDIENLITHHINLVGSNGRDDHLENLITLCFNCHRKVHDGIKINNTWISGEYYLYTNIRKIQNMKNFRWHKFIEEIENDV